jgi:protein-S-isoprenylcysteine O-methyltransferase Ste14
MTIGPDLAIHFAWVAWLFSWWFAAWWRKRAAKRPPILQEIAHLAPTVLGACLLFSTHAPLSDPTRQTLNNPGAIFEPIQLWTTPLEAAWLCFALTVVGFLFCWWARLHLGSLWSGNITIKDGHRVVDTGPYRLVRHPIYTGLLLAAFATAAEKATVVSLAGAGLMLFGFWIKAGFEERFLQTELGREAYDAYAARTPMLVPFLR